jgi:hypothetical protein
VQKQAPETALPVKLSHTRHTTVCKVSKQASVSRKAVSQQIKNVKLQADFIRRPSKTIIVPTS